MELGCSQVIRDKNFLLGINNRLQSTCYHHVNGMQSSNLIDSFKSEGGIFLPDSSSPFHFQGDSGDETNDYHDRFILSV